MIQRDLCAQPVGTQGAGRGSSLAAKVHGEFSHAFNGNLEEERVQIADLGRLSRGVGETSRESHAVHGSGQVVSALRIWSGLSAKDNCNHRPFGMCGVRPMGKHAPDSMTPVEKNRNHQHKGLWMW